MGEKKNTKPNKKRGGTAKTGDFEELIQVKRIVKVVAGGRRFKLRVLMVVGNGNGKFGFAVKKGNEVVTSIEKAVKAAYNNMTAVPRVGTTIPHELTVKYKNTIVHLKPSRNTGLIGNKVVRSIMKSAGVSDVVCKTHGSYNPINITRAILKACKTFLTLEEVKKMRGKNFITYHHIQYPVKDSHDRT